MEVVSCDLNLAHEGGNYRHRRRPHHSSRNVVACAATPSALTVSTPRDIRVMRHMTTEAAARPCQETTRRLSKMNSGRLPVYHNPSQATAPRAIGSLANLVSRS
jgi:hypothetical protein